MVIRPWLMVWMFVNFHEKPRLDVANEYLEINNKYTNNQSMSYYMWNSGMFCFKAGVFG